MNSVDLNSILQLARRALSQGSLTTDSRDMSLLWTSVLKVESFQVALGQQEKHEAEMAAEAVKRKAIEEAQAANEAREAKAADSVQEVIEATK